MPNTLCTELEEARIAFPTTEQKEPKGSFMQGNQDQEVNLALYHISHQLPLSIRTSFLCPSVQQLHLREIQTKDCNTREDGRVQF